MLQKYKVLVKVNLKKLFLQQQVKLWVVFLVGVEKEKLLQKIC